jgi:putative selenate reductase
MLTYSAEQARAEAARCLDCHSYCGICVSVCPNLAMFTYRTKRREQPWQVAVIADLCNECGNCTTFCPTSGAPYRDKPRLYLDRAAFENEKDNAFMIFRDGDAWAIEARNNGVTERLELGAESKDGDAPHDAMLTLLDGVRQSVPFLPVSET